MSDNRPYDEQLVDDVVTALQDVEFLQQYTTDRTDYETVLDPEAETAFGIGNITEGPGDHQAVNGYGMQPDGDPEEGDEAPFTYEVGEDEVYATVTLHPSPLAGKDSTFVFQRTEEGLKVVNEFVNAYY